MPSYSFKKEAKVYIVSGGNQYSIDVSAISFSQTFAQHNYSTKTLHSQSNVFEGSVINKANKASFSFEFPAITEADYTIVETLLIGATSFDLYVTASDPVVDTFKLETAVITNGTFVIEKSRPLSITIQGEASKLTRDAEMLESTVSRTTKTYIRPILQVTLGSNDLSYVAATTMELQNEITWTPYTTLQNSLSATDKSNSMFPSSFTLSKKILSGSITQYLTDVTANDNLANTLNWDTDAQLTIKAGNGAAGNAFRGFSFGPATCSFTNRIGTGSIFTQNYDWRMTQNPSDLSTILKYDTN
jgi:hypothetical protein